MPFNEDGSRKEGALYKKSAFKMKGHTLPGPNQASPVKGFFTIGLSLLGSQSSKNKYSGKKSVKSTTYSPNPNYKEGSARTGNYRFITGEKNPNGSPIGE